MKYQDFSFYLKIISSPRAVKILLIFLSFTREDIGVAMVNYQHNYPITIELLAQACG